MTAPTHEIREEAGVGPTTTGSVPGGKMFTSLSGNYEARSHIGRCISAAIARFGPKDWFEVYAAMLRAIAVEVANIDWEKIDQDKNEEGHP